MFLIRFLIVWIAIAFSPAAYGGEAELRAPTGDIVLKVNGNIKTTNKEGAAFFDVDMLKELGVHKVTTSTIWTEGKNVFEGVRLSDLLELLGVSDGSLRLFAVNDYSVMVPVSEILGSQAMLAFSLNGKRMSLRDKGPLWMIYPYDASEDYQSEIYYARSIWQLNRIEITE